MTKYNAVGWFEIYVDNMAEAKEFYQQVFQVELIPLSNPGIDATPSLEMWGFPIDDKAPGASGAIAKMDGVSPGGTGTVVYFGCEDCSVEEARVAECGGHVMRSKFSIGEHGFISMCTDPAGNMIGLHSMK